MRTSRRASSTRRVLARLVLALLAQSLACWTSSAAEGETTSSSPTLAFAQTHVFPAPERSWRIKVWPKTTPETVTLHLVGERRALAVVEFGENVVAPVNPRLELTHAETNETLTIALNPPTALPGTYGDEDAESADDGERYSTTAYSCVVDAVHVKRGLTITVKEDSAPTTRTFDGIVVGAPTRFEILSLPLYMFGMDPKTATNHKGESLPPDVAGRMKSDAAAEYFARLPVANFTNTQHPSKYFQSSFAVIRPRNGGEAYRLTNADEQRDGFATLAFAMHVLQCYRQLDGSKRLAKQYYGSLIMAGADGTYRGPGGGLGGGDLGTGDFSFGGIFFHEQGHAFGLGHAGDEYSKEHYPYVGGSLKGSAWGYDDNLKKFIDPYFKRCTDSSEKQREDASPHRCFKQDPMQGGAADRDDGLHYNIFSDFNSARVQRWAEGKDVHSGKLFVKKTASVDVYRAWNPETQRFVDVDAKARRDFVTELPKHVNVRLTAAIFAVSCYELNCTSNGFLTPPRSDRALTVLYAPTSYTGDMVEIVDIDDRVLDEYNWEKASKEGAMERRYCDTGCDFIATFHFADGSKSRRMVPSGFRPWVQPLNAVRDEAMDPVHSSSTMHAFAGALGSSPTRVDLEWLPFAWRGAHARVPQLLTSWDADSGEVRAAPPSEAYNPQKVSFDFQLTVPPTRDHCALKRTLPLMRSIEKAVFKAIGGDPKGAARGVSPSLPPLSSVEVVCACSAPTCAIDCAQSFLRPLPEVQTEASPALNSETSDAWKPECGCAFEHFDGDATCSEGAHQSTFVRREHSPGVYYFENDDGRGMMVTESPTIRYEYDRDLDGMIAVCRETRGCVMVEFEAQHARNKTALKAAKMDTGCMSPCYKADYWKRVAYHVDHVNAWVTPASDRPSGAITFRLSVQISTLEGAARVKEMQGSALANVATTLDADETFASLIPWGFSPQAVRVSEVKSASEPPSTNVSPSPSPGESPGESPESPSPESPSPEVPSPSPSTASPSPSPSQESPSPETSREARQWTRRSIRRARRKLNRRFGVANDDMATAEQLAQLVAQTQTELREAETTVQSLIDRRRAAATRDARDEVRVELRVAFRNRRLLKIELASLETLQGHLNGVSKNAAPRAALGLGSTTREGEWRWAALGAMIATTAVALVVARSRGARNAVHDETTPLLAQRRSV